MTNVILVQCGRWKSQDFVIKLEASTRYSSPCQTSLCITKYARHTAENHLQHLSCCANIWPQFPIVMHQPSAGGCKFVNVTPIPVLLPLQPASRLKRPPDLRSKARVDGYSCNSAPKRTLGKAVDRKSRAVSTENAGQIRSHRQSIEPPNRFCFN